GPPTRPGPRRCSAGPTAQSSACYSRCWPPPAGRSSPGPAATRSASAGSPRDRPPADIAAPGPPPAGAAQSRSVAAYGASVAEPAPQPSAGAGSVYEGCPVSWYYTPREGRITLPGQLTRAKRAGSPRAPTKVSRQAAPGARDPVYA